jgi:fructose-1,6-bisphosphatase I
MGHIITLDEFIVRKQKEFPFATGELSGLLKDIGLAGKIVNREVNRAGLINILHAEQHRNASGDEVQKLDMYANEKLVACLKNSGECCAIASEEEDSYVEIPTVESKQARYVVVFDPLDGSSNIDVNSTVGTIFGIYRRKSDSNGPVTLDDFLQKGDALVAAGYVIYGTSTMLVYTTGHGVNGFTLDPSIGEFCLSHEHITIPEKGPYYSVNQGYYHSFPNDVKTYIDKCSDRGRKLRYIGTMVADVHRTLLKGGIFMYPGTKEVPEGKLRLLYECNPMSFLVEQAGGKSINHKLKRIMDVEPKELHQRSTIFMGSRRMVDAFTRKVVEYREIVAQSGHF